MRTLKILALATLLLALAPAASAGAQPAPNCPLVYRPVVGTGHVC